MIADSSNWAIGAPVLTTLRGVFHLYVEVRTLDQRVGYDTAPHARVQRMAGE